MAHPSDEHDRLNSTKTQAMIRRHHTHKVPPHRCGSALVQCIDALLGLVWSLIRQFNTPQAYKQFIRTCDIVAGDGTTEGSIREVSVVTGLPGGWSRERLESLNDESHVMVFDIIGGDHRLANYRSTTTVHEDQGQGGEAHSKRTVVIESYVVDVPSDNSKEDTCTFADTIIGCNLRSLSRVSKKMASSVKV